MKFDFTTTKSLFDTTFGVGQLDRRFGKRCN